MTNYYENLNDPKDLKNFGQYHHIFSQDFQENYDFTQPLTTSVMTINEQLELDTLLVEISHGKSLYINPRLDSDQQTQLIQVLQKQSGAFAWEYKDMCGIHLDTCIQHIYTQENVRPIRQPQRRMNPILKDIVKDALQKLLNANFIYPIFDSKWVSPLVIVPEKNGKWRVCVDFRKLNRATLRDYFPLPFINQVLDTLSGKQYFSFLDGYSGYNQIQIALEHQEKTTLTCPWGTFSYRVLPFVL